MAIGVLRIFIVSSILGYVLVSGRPQGARARRGAVCDDNGFDILSNLGGTPSSLPIPIDVTFLNVPESGYVPGRSYNIRIRADTNANRFRRFMIQGRARSDNSPVGSFGSDDDSQPECANDTAAIHISMNQKRRVVIPWTAPPAGTGCICFKYSIVIDSTRYWANLTTPCISEDPQTLIQFEAGGSTSGSNFTISLNATVDGEYECSLDGGSYQACSSGDVFPNLSAGSHSINVRFTPDGYCQPLMQELTLNFTISTPVQITISGGASISGDTATISLDANVDGTFECSVDGLPFEPCASGDMFPGFSDGAHFIDVRFTAAGSSQTAMTRINFVIVTGRVGISIDGDTLTITLDETLNGTYECRVDAGPFAPCVSGDTISGISVGSHTFDFRFTPAGTSQTTTGRLTFEIGAVTEFSLNATATYSGNTITVTYEVSSAAMCTCQLNQMAAVPCESGHMFTNVPNREHSVTVTCISTVNPMLMATAMVSGLQFLSVDLSLESAGTSITVVPQANIGATYRCSLDGGPFVDCIPGFQFQGVSGGNHTVTVEATSLNGLTMLNVSGTISVRGSDAISVTSLSTAIDIPNQNYNFTFTLNEKLDDLITTLLIDGSPIRVPFECRRISGVLCYCNFTIPNMEYTVGAHNITFQSILNGEIRGSTTSSFVVSNVAVAKFKDTAYSVVEGDRSFMVVIEKEGETANDLNLVIDFIQGSATEDSDYPLIQLARRVTIPAGPSTDVSITLDIRDDSVRECNETFTLDLRSTDNTTQIDPGRGQATVTIIDDDATSVIFRGNPNVDEGASLMVTVFNENAVDQNFTVTVESYECAKTRAGVDYEPVNEIIEFNQNSFIHFINIITIDNDVFEADKRICLRITNVTEPCPGYVSIGDDLVITIEEDDSLMLTLRCFTNTTGNTADGRVINLFYSVPSQLSPDLFCEINNEGFEICGSSPRSYIRPYGNYNVTVRAVSTLLMQTVIITHQVLMVQGRLRVVNSSAIQISIQSTKSARYTCRLNETLVIDPCNDGDVIANLDPRMYTLMVNATSNDIPPQFASDVVGPITVSGRSAQATCSGMAALRSADNVSSYTASWRGRGDRVEFVLMGQGEGWVGIGFSHNQIMAESDIILGAADASNSFVDDRYATAQVQPPRDRIQNVDDTSASFEDGVTTVRFSRLKDTGDVDDFSLSDCIHFLYAWGGGVTDFSTGQIEYHGALRRFISNSLICIPTSVTFCPERFDCNDPGTPRNGTLMLINDTLEGSIARYTCDFGFMLVGNQERVCQSNTTWSGALPFCIRIDCGDPGVPLNGSVSSSGSFVTDVANFTCDFGFELMGDTQRVCQENGMWSNMVPNCTRITCGDPGMPLNGSVSSSGSFVTDVANFTCDFGFELMGDTQRVCEENGMWTNMVPNCSRISCGDPGSVINGMVTTTDGNFVNSVATFTCDFGYILDGDDQRICQPNGSWSSMPPVCTPVDCGPPGVPQNGNVGVITTTFGATVMYSCSPTYILCGNDTRVCQGNATWSGVVPDCIRSVATVERTSYVIPEDGGAVDIGILLDQPNCVTLNITLDPQEQSPVDASTFDFDDTPIVVMILPGDTNATVPIPIINDTVVEGPERFNAVLLTDGMDGFIIGTPGQSEVTIIDDADTITVIFEMPEYNVTELEGQVEVCLLSSRNNEVPVTVVVQPEQMGSAQVPDDFTLTSSMVTFGAGQRRACYNQSVVNDELFEPTESFVVRIMDNPDITIGTPGVSQINIIDGTNCTIPCIDGVFVLDVSQSIGNGMEGEEAFNLMKNFVASTFDLVNISDTCSRAGLILFASDTRIEFDLNAHTDNTSLRTALNNITLENIREFRRRRGTNTPGVLNLIRTAAEDGSLGLNLEDRVQVAIIITDGRPSLPNVGRMVETELTRRAGEELRRAEIYEQIYAIGIEGRENRTINEDTLELITGNRDTTFLIDGFTLEEFNEAALNLSRQVCNNPCLLVSCPAGSRCRLCNETGETYCEFSCDFENGGCEEGSLCIEVNVPTCSPDQCCSLVNVTCQSMIMRNDTVIGDPLYTVPLQISDEMMEADPDVANASLCYEIHGTSGSTYNLVSDTCVSINAEYMQGNTSDINIVGRVGVLAVDDNGACQRITIDVMECTGTVGSTEVTQDSPYDSAGIRVRKGRRYFRIAVPNCERQDLVSWVICEQGDMLKFVITRGFNLQPTSHGLVGQFWNVPVELDEFTGTKPDNLTYYTVTVTPPDGDVRSFVGHLYDVTWDFTPVPCVYAGNRNGGPVFEFDNPNDSVIEGNYTLYEVSDLFSTGFTYEQFDEARCN